jgi:hypothetical protein
MDMAKARKKTRKPAAKRGAKKARRKTARRKAKRTARPKKKGFIAETMDLRRKLEGSNTFED